MSDTPEVSVVMGVRDGGDELAPSVESILSQQGVELELIVVDDGSTDGTAERLAAFAARDARVRASSQEPSGLTAALIRGCALARAPLIARHDAGDRSHPERLRREIDLLARFPEAVLVSCRTLCLGPESEPLYVEPSKGEAATPVSILAGEPPSVVAGPSSHGAALFSVRAYRSAGGYRSEFALGQDWDLWQRLSFVGSFAALPEVLYSRTLALDSLSFALRDRQWQLGRLSLASARRRARGADESEFLAEACALSSRIATERAALRARGRTLGAYHVGEILRRRGDPRARRYLSRAVRERPLFARAWVRLAQAWLGALRSRSARVDDLDGCAWALVELQ